MSDLINMDPALLTPAQRVRRDVALQQASQTQFQSDFGQPDPNSSMPPNDGQPDDNFRVPSVTEPGLLAMVARANAAKIELDLSPKYGALLDKYIHVSCAFLPFCYL